MLLKIAFQLSRYFFLGVRNLTVYCRSRKANIPSEVSEKSKSLEGRVNSQGSHRVGDSDHEYKHFYHAGSDAQSLDQAVKEMYDKRTAAAGN